jgi:nonribosomal peptide synthetase DhbF
MEEHITKILPLSVAQQSMWFAQKFAHPDAIFNVAEYLEIHGPIDPQKLEDALRIAVMEAEAVRAHFTESGGRIS